LSAPIQLVETFGNDKVGDQSQLIGKHWMEIFPVRCLQMGLDFFAGQDLPAIGFGPDDFENEFPDESGSLLMHWPNVFTFLSMIPPWLHIAQHRGTLSVVLPG